MKRKLASICLAGAMAAVMLAGCGADPSASGSSTSGASSAESGSETAADSSGAQEGAEGETVYPLTVTDDLGMEVTIEEEPEQVVSLSPANTETLFAIGAGSRVAGRTDYCNYPQEAAEVDSIGSYSSPNMELIISKTPDVVFASDYIDDSIRAQLEENGAKVVVFAGSDVSSVQNDIMIAGQIMNCNEEAEKVTSAMSEELAELQEIVSGVQEPKSAFIDLGSFYSAGKGSLLGNMLLDLGVENIVDDTGEMWPQLSVETIIEKNPDVYISLFTTPEELKQTAGVSELDCIKNDQIIFFDGLSPEADMIQRAGPRLVEGTKLLAEQIYPELFAQ